MKGLEKVGAGVDYLVLPPSSLPDRADREKWGMLSPDTVQRLTDKTGSEEQVSSKTDIWPNDDGYETLSLRCTRLERD